MKRETYVDWETFDRAFRALAGRQVAEGLSGSAPHFDDAVAFASGRLEEGRRVGEFFASRLDRPIRVLDVGSGNGGVAIGLANICGFQVHSADVILNWSFAELRKELRSGARQYVASGHALPFAGASFDVVLCLETIEHVTEPEKMGREIMRVLRPGGMCMVMTPARIKHLLRRDPHYGVPGLLLLPDSLQRIVVTSILRRTPRALYDVVHTFWTLKGLGRMFPGHSAIVPLFNHPRTENRLWNRYQRFLWDRVLITK